MARLVAVVTGTQDLVSAHYKSPHRDLSLELSGLGLVQGQLHVVRIVSHIDHMPSFYAGSSLLTTVF
jgi:hypothetical protein